MIDKELQKSVLRKLRRSGQISARQMRMYKKLTKMNRKQTNELRNASSGGSTDQTAE